MLLKADSFWPILDEDTWLFLGPIKLLFLASMVYDDPNSSSRLCLLS